MTTNILPPPPDADRGESLRDRREAAGLTRPQLAGLADCSVGAIERIEGGYRPRRSDVLPRLYAAITDAEASR